MHITIINVLIDKLLIEITLLQSTRKPQKLTIEVFKVNHGLSAELVSGNFHLRMIFIILDKNQKRNLGINMLVLK